MEKVSDDPVSQIFRGELNPARQAALDEIDRRSSTLDEVMQARYKIPSIRALIAGQRISFDQVLLERACKFPQFEKFGLLMIALLLTKKMRWITAVNTLQYRTNLLEWEPMVQAIASGEIIQEQVLIFNKRQLRNLNFESVRKGVEDKKWTVGEALNFTASERVCIDTFGVPRFKGW